MVEVETPAWLKSLPVAPEYHPTEAEFADPISFISRVEEEAGQYGICKVVPPLPKASKRTAISNILKLLDATGDGRFVTKTQQLGWSFKPGQGQPLAHMNVWQSGECHALDEFEAKAKSFARGALGTCKELPASSLETLFWRAVEGAPMLLQCANDIDGSAFAETDEKQDKARVIKDREGSLGWKLACSGWNIRHISRSLGSLLRNMSGNIPGLTSPLLEIAMLFCWTGWHLEDHELYKLDYLHLGSSKTWYAVPGDAAGALEEFIRVFGYGAQFAFKETLQLLGERTTILSPEILTSAGIPCCRLVQNPGEFVVTFPRAYRFVFNHGFGCSESANFAAPGWLKVAKQATVRRIAIDKPSLLCHEQLLYQSALFFCRSKGQEARSSRLKHKNKVVEMIKEEFMKSMATRHQVFAKLSKSGQAKCILLEIGDAATENICNLVNFGNLRNIDSISLLSFVCESMASNTDKQQGSPPSPRVDWGSLSCTICGILCFSSIVIVQRKANWEAKEEVQAQSSKECELSSPCILCSEHALEVHSRLQQSRMLVVCHPEYQLFEDCAREVAKDINIDFVTIGFQKGDAEDFSTLNLAISMPSLNESWAVQLVRPELSLYSSLKQTHTNPASDESDEELKATMPVKEKKCWVVGRWCGRAWRYDQTNSALGGCKSAPCFPKALPVETRDAGSGSTEELAEDHPARKSCRKKKRSHMATSWRVEQEPAYGLTFPASSSEMATDYDSGVHCSSELIGHPVPDAAGDRDYAVPDSRSQNPEVEHSQLSDPGEQNLEERGTSAMEAELPSNKSAVKGVEQRHWYSAAGNVVEMEPAPSEQGANAASEQLVICDEEQNKNEQPLAGGRELQGQDQAFETKRETGTVLEGCDDSLGGTQPELKAELACSQMREATWEIAANAEPVCEGSQEAENEANTIFPPWQSTLCHSNSVWHDVPISCSPMFHSQVSFATRYTMAEGGDANGKNNNNGRALQELYSPRPKKLAVKKAKRQEGNDAEQAQAQAQAFEGSFIDEDIFRGQPSGGEDVSDVSTSSVQDLFTAADDAADGENNSVHNTRSRRASKIDCWKSLQASEEEDDEYRDRSDRKASGGGKGAARGRKRKAEARGADAAAAAPLPSAICKRNSHKGAYSPEGEEGVSGAYKCDFDGCSMGFRTEAELLLHKRNMCTIEGCGKQLCSHSYLVQHYRVHVDDRPLKCPWKGCKKSFKWSWARTEHIRVHTGERPYACADCGKSYRFVSDFSRHKRTTGHTGTGLC